MNLIQSIRQSFYRDKATPHLMQLATKKAETKRFLAYAEKAISRTRQDIAAWNQALLLANAEEPKNFPLQLLYNEIMLDALLTSQVENRRNQVMSRPVVLRKPTGEVDEAQTAILRALPATRQLTALMLDAAYFGYSLTELELQPGKVGSTLLAHALPRTNIVPQRGLFFPDYSEDKSIKYREMPEFGTYILEFNSGALGLLNKAVPHVLFKRFAQSCWSELCEIYGIPPRVLKTNTQDDIMLRRAEKMMADMGAAAWFIVDTNETMEWATGASTNGEVYQRLISLCNNEISLLISGAVIGQDTQFGNRSKDEAAQTMLWELTQADMAQVTEWWNNIVLPAMQTLGVIKGDFVFEFEAAEDLDQLWTRTTQALPYFNVDSEWVKDKFGIEITGERTGPSPALPQGEGALNAAGGFFI